MPPGALSKAAAPGRLPGAQPESHAQQPPGRPSSSSGHGDTLAGEPAVTPLTPTQEELAREIELALGEGLCDAIRSAGGEEGHVGEGGGEQGAPTEDRPGVIVQPLIPSGRPRMADKGRAHGREARGVRHG